MAFRFILAPEAGFLAFINKIWPGLWNPALHGVDAMIAIVVAFAWKYVGYNFIFFLAALQAIPRSLIEASAMDGANWFRRMRDIQLPLLAPTTFFLIVINLTDSFTDSFGIVDIMTQGGPARATDLMVYKIYFDGFKGLDYSGAAAQSIILMVLVILLTIAQFRFIERRIHYK
jgi:sn-glycerol 3-phosphate transport system permease protein